MKYLLDSNVVIGLAKRNPELTRRVAGTDPSEIGISVIVMHELFFGAYKGRKVSANLQAIAELEFDVVDFNVEDARQAGQVRASLAAAGTPIGPYDVLIAAQALARDLTLITHNTREFARVGELKIEDWER
jgi:tRNA(fMet)-specific endonuclease VapC